ncbi:MAG: CtsR family transcriptional regulator [Bacillota bacterium]|nr:CtsR family transcriptional regulator [Bacillota bacterium]
MPNLTDYIEDYLKKLLALSTNQHIEIKRRELAGKFDCVPSQINYVLERRFSLARGYLVESRRGGSGCIRIYRIEPEQPDAWREVISILTDEEFEPSRLKHLIKRMYDDKIISRRESRLLEKIISDEIYLFAGLSREKTRKLQKRLFSDILEELLKTGY